MAISTDGAYTASAIESERVLLGAVLTRRAAADIALDSIQAADFYRPAHQSVFEAVSELRMSNSPTDRVSVTQWLKDRGRLESVGGFGYLSGLTENAVPNSDVAFHARTVRDKAVRRAMYEAGLQVAAFAGDEEVAVSESLEAGERAIYAVRDGLGAKAGTRAPLCDILRRVYESAEAAQDDPGRGGGIKTGLVALDRLMIGMKPADLIVLAGRPSMGKTSAALAIAVHAARVESVPTLVFSLEMSQEQLGLRLVCMEAQVSNPDVDLGVLDQDGWSRFAKATSDLYDVPMDVDDGGGMTLAGMRAAARRFRAERGGLGLIVVDYLELVTPPRQTGNAVQEVGEVARGLKEMAKEFACPVLLLSQLSREVEKRTGQRPMMSDLRQSGAIEAAADKVLLLFRADYYFRQADPNFVPPTVEETEVIVAKHRNGATGVARVGFMSEHAKFCNLAPEMDDPLAPTGF